MREMKGGNTLPKRHHIPTRSREGSVRRLPILLRYIITLHMGVALGGTPPGRANFQTVRLAEKRSDSAGPGTLLLGISRAPGASTKTWAPPGRKPAQVLNATRGCERLSSGAPLTLPVRGRASLRQRLLLPEAS